MMTPVERAINTLAPILGARLANRIRSNLPSRKPQLWEQLVRDPRTIVKLRHPAKLRSSDPNEPLLVKLPEFDVTMELLLRRRKKDLALYKYGVYEISGTRFIQTVLASGMNVIDVGANGGYYTLIAARLVGSHGHVRSLEPIAGPFARLRRNIELNGFQNVTIRRAAVGDHTGKSKIYASAIEDNDGLGALRPGLERASTPRDVELWCLDDIVAEMPNRSVDLVKVDVEGSEADVFAGGRNTLNQPEAPALVFESFNIGPIAELLSASGYEVRRLHYSLRSGLEFPRVGEIYDDIYTEYEPPNFVALKQGWSSGSFEEIADRSKQRIPMSLRVISALA